MLTIPTLDYNLGSRSEECQMLSCGNCNFFILDTWADYLGRTTEAAGVLHFVLDSRLQVFLWSFLPMLYAQVFCLYVCLYHMPPEVRGRGWIVGTLLPEGCQLPCISWEPKPGPLQERVLDPQAVSLPHVIRLKVTFVLKIQTLHQHHAYLLVE